MSFIMFQKALIALLILPFGTAYAQKNPVPTTVQDLVRASQCPANMGCGTPAIVHLDPVYKLEPIYVTSEILHVERPVHQVWKKEYVAKVIPEVVEQKGICETFIRQNVNDRPVVVVWTDRTTTSHFYTTNTTTVEITHVEKVTEDVGCYKEIGRASAKPTLPARPVPSRQRLHSMESHNQAIPTEVPIGAVDEPAVVENDEGEVDVGEDEV